MAYVGSIVSKEVVRASGDYPIKLYMFKSVSDGFPDKDSIINDLLRLIDAHPQIVQDSKYSIALAWAYKEKGKSCLKDNSVRAFDVFSYKFDKSWGVCNPDVGAWVFKNFSSGDPYNEAGPEVTCETGTIILGKEAELRRTTKTLEGFLKKWPDLGLLDYIGPIWF